MLHSAQHARSAASRLDDVIGFCNRLYRSGAGKGGIRRPGWRKPLIWAGSPKRAHFRGVRARQPLSTQFKVCIILFVRRRPTLARWPCALCCVLTPHSLITPQRRGRIRGKPSPRAVQGDLCAAFLQHSSKRAGEGVSKCAQAMLLCREAQDSLQCVPNEGRRERAALSLKG
jgi:hypothetical protein